MKRLFRWNETISFVHVQGRLCLFFFSLLVLTFGGSGKTVYSLEQEVAEKPAVQLEQLQAVVEPEKRYVKIEFDNVDILVFIRFIGEVTGKNFVIDPRVKGNVTVVAPTEISVDEAYKVFQSVLEVHGFTAVPAGSIIKIVPSSDARGKGVETQFGH